MSDNNQEPTVNNIPLERFVELESIEKNYDQLVFEQNQDFEEAVKRVREEYNERWKKDREHYSSTLKSIEKKYNESALKKKVDELESKYNKEHEELLDNKETIMVLKCKLSYQEEVVEELKNRTLIQRIFRKYE